MIVITPALTLHTSMLTSRVLPCIPDARVEVVNAQAASYDRGHCSHELSVQEQVGEVAIDLRRSGNMEHEVNVSCSTQSRIALSNLDFESLDTSNVITFAPNQEYATCVVSIYDDALYERKEQFYVSVQPADGLVVTAGQDKPVCIYILKDPSDGE